MKFNFTLFRWLFRGMATQAIIGLLLAIPYLLLKPEPFRERDMAPAFFVLIHCVALTALLGRFRSGPFAFLYGRGFGRDALWFHAMLATAAGALVVWLPAALTIWTPLRCLVQDRLFESPFFPLMAVGEHGAPWVWLFGYALLMPVFHYAWIREAHPDRGGLFGGIAAVGMAFVFLCGVEGHLRHELFRTTVFTLAGVVAMTALFAGWRLHRELEAQA